MIQSSASWQACRLELCGWRGEEEEEVDEKKDVQFALVPEVGLWQ